MARRWVTRAVPGVGRGNCATWLGGIRGIRQVDAVLLSIGGNDCGFSGVLTDLVKGDNVFTANDDNDPAAVKARLDARLLQPEANYDRVAADITRLLRPQEVYINGYPTALFDQTRADGTIRFHACACSRVGTWTSTRPTTT